MSAEFDRSEPRLRFAEAATPAEQFSVWAMRLWWSAFPELDAAWPDLVRGFRVCTSPAALEPFHRFCSVTLSAAGCGAGIACLRCPRITLLEDRLLESLAAAAAGDADVEMVLRTVLPASAARLAAPHAIRFAQLIAEAGLGWPQPVHVASVRAGHESPFAALAAGESRRLH